MIMILLLLFLIIILPVVASWACDHHLLLLHLPLSPSTRPPTAACRFSCLVDGPKCGRVVRYVLPPKRRDPPELMAHLEANYICWPPPRTKTRDTGVWYSVLGSVLSLVTRIQVVREAVSIHLNKLSKEPLSENRE